MLRRYLISNSGILLSALFVWSPTLGENYTEGEPKNPMVAAGTATLIDYGAICDGRTHPLAGRFGNLSEAKRRYPSAVSLSQQIDQVAIEDAISHAAKTKSGIIHLPIGSCLMSGSLAIQVAEGSSVDIRGAGLGSRLVFPAGMDGLVFSLSPLSSSIVSPALEPSVALSHFQILTAGTKNSVGTAVRVYNITPTGSQFVNNGTPQIAVDHLRIQSQSGGGHSGMPGSWAIGLRMIGLSNTSVLNSFFIGGKDDNESVAFLYESMGAPTGASNVHINNNNEMDYGGTFLKAGSTNTVIPIQGIDVHSWTTVGNQYDFVASANADGIGDWLAIVGGNSNSAHGSLISRWNTLEWRGNYCLDNPGPCLTIDGGHRLYIGAGSQYIGGSPQIVLSDVHSTPGDGTAVLQGNHFSSMATPPIKLRGSTAGVLVEGNSSLNGLPLVDDQTGLQQLIGWNMQAERWSFGKTLPSGAPAMTTDQVGNLYVASLTGQAVVSSGPIGASWLQLSAMRFDRLPPCTASHEGRLYLVIDKGRPDWDGHLALCHSSTYFKH